MARIAVLLVALLCASVALAQTVLVLDKMDVNQATLSSNSAGVVSNYNCGTSSSNLAGGIRKLSITAPAGTNVGNSVQLGVFIPSGQTTAPNGVSSGNNNLQSPSFQILYRLDGQSSLCSSGTNTVSTTAIAKTTNNLNINLQSIGAFAFQFNAQGDVTPNTVTVTLYNSSGSALATSTPILVVETGQTPNFDAYILPFSDSTKWTSGSSFTGTVGAVELAWAVPANLQFAVNLVQFQVQSTVSVGATVFLDCGCNGFQQGSGDSLQSGVAVTLAVSGTGCAASSTTLTTTSSGTVSFTGVPGGCTYTLSTSGLGLCSNSASSQTVAAGGNANFAISGTASTLTIPPNKSVPCGTDTTPATTGTASVGGGSCGGSTGSATFVDTVAASQCTPGGAISVISRAWTGAGSTQTQTITVTDTQSLTFTNVPASTTIQCNDNVPTTTATATSCTAVTVTSADSTSTGTCDTTTCSSSSTITRTFTASDACGNTKTATQTIGRAGCAVACPPPPPPSVPPPPTAAPPPPTNLPTNANCRFICDDDDSSAAQVIASVAVLLIAALAAF